MHQWRIDPVNNPRSPMLVKSYLKQILCAIHACHCYRIMHRDMKPQNILIGQD